MSSFPDFVEKRNATQRVQMRVVRCDSYSGRRKISLQCFSIILKRRGIKGIQKCDKKDVSIIVAENLEESSKNCLILIFQGNRNFMQNFSHVSKKLLFIVCFISLYNYYNYL